jgi:transposase
VRWWRTFDVGRCAAFVEAAAPRVRCAEHGVTVAAVPWARHGAGHTRAFDDLVAWFTTRMSKTALASYLRVGWATVGAIIARVMADADAAAADRLDGITRIGVDEISYKRGYKYLTVVVDHTTRRVLLKVRPTEVVTDAALVYPAVLDELMPTAWHQVERHPTKLTGSDRCEACAPTGLHRRSSPDTPSCRT